MYERNPSIGKLWTIHMMCVSDKFLEVNSGTQKLLGKKEKNTCWMFQTELEKQNVPGRICKPCTPMQPWRHRAKRSRTARMLHSDWTTKRIFWDSWASEWGHVARIGSDCVRLVWTYCATERQESLLVNFKLFASIFFSAHRDAIMMTLLLREMGFFERKISPRKLEKWITFPEKKKRKTWIKKLCSKISTFSSQIW